MLAIFSRNVHDAIFFSSFEVSISKQNNCQSLYIYIRNNLSTNNLAVSCLTETWNFLP